jgi:hypothetical protein
MVPLTVPKSLPAASPKLNGSASRSAHCWCGKQQTQSRAKWAAAIMGLPRENRMPNTPRPLTQRQVDAIVQSHPAAQRLVEETLRQATASPEGIEGWWEFAVGGHKRFGTEEETAPPSFSSPIEEVLNQIARYPDRGLYVLRRWVRPGGWAKFEPTGTDTDFDPPASSTLNEGTK